MTLPDFSRPKINIRAVTGIIAVRASMEVPPSAWVHCEFRTIKFNRFLIANQMIQSNSVLNAFALIGVIANQHHQLIARDAYQFD